MNDSLTEEINNLTVAQQLQVQGTSCGQTPSENAYVNVARMSRDVSAGVTGVDGLTSITECVRCKMTFRQRHHFDEHDCEKIRKAAAQMAQTITQAVNSNMPHVGVGGIKMEDPQVSQEPGIGASINSMNAELGHLGNGNGSSVSAVGMSGGMAAVSQANQAYINSAHNSSGSSMPSIALSSTMSRTKAQLPTELLGIDNGVNVKTEGALHNTACKGGMNSVDRSDMDVEKLQQHALAVAQDDPNAGPSITSAAAHSNVNAALTAQAQAALGANLPAYFSFNLAPYVHMLPQLQQQQQQQQAIVSPQQAQQAHPSQHQGLQQHGQPHRSQDLAQNLDENCKFCGQQFQNLEDLRLHWRRAHKSQNVCDFCGSQHASYCALANHKALKHPTKTPYECHQCGQRFSRRCLLKRHLQKVKHQRSAWNKV